jgi:hypothetical protein
VLSLDTLTTMEILCFTTCWSPTDLLQFPRWRTWPQYFADYDAVRDELLASAFHSRHLEGGLPFADRAREALAAAGPGETWGKHDHAALRHAHLYQRGDAHVHDDEARLGAAVEIEGEPCPI